MSYHVFRITWVYFQYITNACDTGSVSIVRLNTSLVLTLTLTLTHGPSNYRAATDRDTCTVAVNFSGHI